jgi:hypothetical protein
MTTSFHREALHFHMAGALDAAEATSAGTKATLPEIHKQMFAQVIR